MDIKNLKMRKKALKLTNQNIADLTDIPVSTINKIFSGATKSPRYDTLLAIEDVIGKKEMESDEITRYEYGKCMDNPMMVKETSNYAFTSRRYTEKDLDQLPPGSFAELMDGVLYFKGMPSLTHERIICRMTKKINDYIEKHHGSCEVFSSHYAMRLRDADAKGDETNVMLPDIMVVCNPDILTEELCDGPADWIVEVVSPYNAKNDYQKKSYHYRKGGIREYWIVDPQKRIVTVFDYESEQMTQQEGITIYSFEEQIPVRIYPGFSICLQEIT